MAHQQQRDFFQSVKDKHPYLFKGFNVLDIGSLDINGNNRFLFEDYKYTGVDIGPGKNVDVVSKGHEYKSKNKFDVVISAECFEHDMYYHKTLLNCLELTKSGGLFTFSCATTGRPEHGTLRTRPLSSPHTTNIAEWSNYYKNLTEDDVREVLDIDELFTEYEFSIGKYPADLYFYGIKK